MQLSVADKKELLRIARTSIASALSGRPHARSEGRRTALKEHCGAFVTLHLHSELRGCIGYIEARFPLHETIEEAAVKAALEDPRFLPLTAEELKNVEIEISVLSPLQKTTNIEEIVVGRHGLVIDAGHARGLLLPQVATEYGWGREQFLSQTCRKAGLPVDAWKKKGVSILTFTSDVFSEAEFQKKKH
ncbi:MAG: AmmeMemoRadiSam system protein A [Ignavibacteriales bacterium]|nr:AmmeMemoRadiSam system protein A [Ignavibacteriales bacterium]